MKLKQFTSCRTTPAKKPVSSKFNKTIGMCVIEAIQTKMASPIVFTLQKPKAPQLYVQYVKVVTVTVQNAYNTYCKWTCASYRCWMKIIFQGWPLGSQLNDKYLANRGAWKVETATEDVENTRLRHITSCSIKTCCFNWRTFLNLLTDNGSHVVWSQIKNPSWYCRYLSLVISYDWRHHN